MIMITGATGFLGRHIAPVLIKRYGGSSIILLSSNDYDLLDRDQVNSAFKKYNPKVVIHLAAYSGGIGANRTYPADFYYRNTILTANVFDAAARCKVDKLIYPMGGCSYPATAKSPIEESQLWNGYPQAESAAYSTAKMMGVVAAQSYKKQYNLNSTVIIPGNMYGEYDNFHPLDSHVVPSMIRRYFEASLRSESSIVQWGSGRPERDFVYAGDVAAVIPFFIEKYNEVGPINISTGTRISIKELAETISNLNNFKGEITWDEDKPDGQLIKIFDVSQFRSLGLDCSTPLHVGLKKTIQWFTTNYPEATDGIRL
jgi:GDP-L-fucose synthase